MLELFRKKQKIQEAPPPVGVSEIIVCVFDEKKRVLHHFKSNGSEAASGDWFKLLNDPEHAFESFVLREAVATHKSVSVSFTYGEGQSKYLYILPYERNAGNWRFICMQVASARPNPGAPSARCALAEDRVCLLLADSQGMVVSVSSKVPQSFGFSSGGLVGMKLSDFFAPADLGMIISCSPDTNESILSCVFHCLDGSKREVEVKKYSSTDGCMLYGICDVTRLQINEELIQVGTRERRRIGQDLHDSIGQLLTGISLLSRSLANSLQRDGNSGDADAAQISELADDANNQIRQISRGLMPSDIVQCGLFPSLENLARITTNSCGLLCEVQLDETVEFADSAVETHLFRIAQESVNNAVRHANATRIDIIVSQSNGMPQLEICDDGMWKGIQKDSGGIGMKTMQYRATAICGQLNIGPSEQGGTTVACRLEVDELLETKA
ncbi:MAG: sensor histidine kinase [Pontiella sp.]